MKRLPAGNYLRSGIGSCFETTLVYLVLRELGPSRAIRNLGYETRWEQSYPFHPSYHVDLELHDTTDRMHYFVEVKWAYGSLRHNIKGDVDRIQKLLVTYPERYGGYMLLLYPKYGDWDDLTDVIKDEVEVIRKRLKVPGFSSNGLCRMALVPVQANQDKFKPRFVHMDYYDDEKGGERQPGRFQWILLRAELQWK